jgi:hypothetical protein
MDWRRFVYQGASFPLFVDVFDQSGEHPLLVRLMIGSIPPDVGDEVEVDEIGAVVELFFPLTKGRKRMVNPQHAQASAEALHAWEATVRKVRSLPPSDGDTIAQLPAQLPAGLVATRTRFSPSTRPPQKRAPSPTSPPLSRRSGQARPWWTSRGFSSTQAASPSAPKASTLDNSKRYLIRSFRHTDRSGGASYLLRSCRQAAGHRSGGRAGNHKAP